MQSVLRQNITHVHLNSSRRKLGYWGQQPLPRAPSWCSRHHHHHHHQDRNYIITESKIESKISTHIILSHRRCTFYWLICCPHLQTGTYMHRQLPAQSVTGSPTSPSLNPAPHPHTPWTLIKITSQGGYTPSAWRPRHQHQCRCQQFHILNSLLLLFIILFYYYCLIVTVNMEVLALSNYSVFFKLAVFVLIATGIFSDFFPVCI